MSNRRIMVGLRELGRWRRTSILAALGSACSLLLGCGDVRTDFLGTRVADPCDGVWNVCATRVGCLVGDRSYVEGRFPGTAQVAIQVFEPSAVTVALLPAEIAGAGDATVFTLYEAACTSPQRVELSGTAFIGEAEKVGFVQRTVNLIDVGDHLVQVQSDARTRYLMKVDVLPLRLKDAAGP